MSATILEIDERPSSVFFAPRRLSDFDYHEGGSLSPVSLIGNPGFSLYCVDDDRRRVIFVETPPGLDLTQVPFYYMAQYKHAQRLVALPYDTLFQLTDRMGSLDHLILIFSVGRCGSTLLSQIFNEVDAVSSFSEPDILTSLQLLREPDGKRDAELTTLLKSCIRVICKPESCPTFVVKGRNWLTEIGDLLHAAFPAARNLFLYRNAERWANSWHRILEQSGQDFDGPAQMWAGEEEIHTRLNPFALEYTEGFGRTSAMEMLVTAWLSAMDRYLKLVQQGVPFLAVRFEDLNARREQVVKAIFDYCGVPISQVGAALQAFEHDSQEGTPLQGTSQENGPKQLRLSAGQLARLRALLQKHDTIKTPDFTVPGTLEVR